MEDPRAGEDWDITSFVVGGNGTYRNPRYMVGAWELRS